MQHNKDVISYLIDTYGVFLTVDNITEIIKVSRPIVDGLIRSGDLPSIRVGRQYRVGVADFIQWYDDKVGMNCSENLLQCLCRKIP